MDRRGDGNGWIFGLCFICLGIVCVLSMGVFSFMYYGGMIGECCKDYSNIIFKSF